MYERKGENILSSYHALNQVGRLLSFEFLHESLREPSRNWTRALQVTMHDLESDPIHEAQRLMIVPNGWPQPK